MSNKKITTKENLYAVAKTEADTMLFVSNTNNLLMGHSFEDLNNWHPMSYNYDNIEISSYPYELYTKFGRKLLRIRSYVADCTENGVRQTIRNLPIGQYVFSAYVRVLSDFVGGMSAGAYIRVVGKDGAVLAESKHLAKHSMDYVRLVVPFKITSMQSVQLQLLMNGKSIVYFDGVQVENSLDIHEYNMLEKGRFEKGIDDGIIYACQNVYVKTNRATRETFTLSGWAKLCKLPNSECVGVHTSTFRLRAVVHYNDGYYKYAATETFTTDIFPCTQEWQFVSVQFAKNKYRTVNFVTVYCEYANGSGSVCFDDIRLVRNSIEEYLFPSDFEEESKN